jgi:LPXTG-motif cell wall-anchored protein
MNSPRFTRTFAYSVLAVAVILIACTAGVTAQDTSQTTTQQGTAEQQVTVQRGEVVYVSGNDLVVRNLDTGEVKSFVVPDSARVTVDGQELSVHDLKPGMKLQRTITTTTTPQTVTTVRTIQGTVWHINAPISVILTLPDGTNKQYHIPKDQKFMVNGQEVDAFHLREGMNVTATVITTAPRTEIAESRSVTGQMPAPPPTPPMEGALLIEEPAAPAPPQAPPTVAAAQPAPKLPQTGSVLPLMGLLGALLSGIGVAGYLRRP